MPSRNAQLADAVKGALNAAPNGTFVLPFVAKRVAVPANNLQALKTLTVSVIPYADEGERTARDLSEHDMSVYVGIEKVLTTPDASLEKANTEVDQLMQLVEQVNDFFGNDTVDRSLAMFIDSRIRVLCDPPSLKSMNLFRGVVAVHFLKAVG